MSRIVRNSNLPVFTRAVSVTFVDKLVFLRFSNKHSHYSVMTEDNSELRKLEHLRDELLRRVYKLRDEMGNPETSTLQNDRCIAIAANLSQLFVGSTVTNDSFDSDKTASSICEASQSALGIRFKNVQKNWKHDNVYRYDALVVTKAIQFDLELTVDIKTDKEHVFEDIKCRFADIDENYMKEIIPWSQRFSKEKQFPYLMSALSDYNERSVTRAKILNSLKSKGYATLEKCDEEGGGILIYFHSPKASDEILFKIQWYERFVDKTWRIEHIFVIDPVQADEEFVGENRALLKSFCRIGLRKKDLEELWKKLCLAVDDN